MYWKLSLLTSSLTAIVTFCFILAVTESWGPSLFAGALVLLVVTVLVVGPHIAFGALTLSLRSHRVLSGVLLLIVLAVSISGLVAFSFEAIDYLSRDKSSPEGQRMGPFLIGLAQWIAAVTVAAVLLPVFFRLKRVEQKGVRSLFRKKRPDPLL